MARDPNARFTLRTKSQARAEHLSSSDYADAGIDVGLRNYMLKVYNYMTLGVALTGAVAFAVSTSPVLIQTIFGTPLKWLVMLAPLGFIFFFSFRIHKMSANAAQMTFWLFAGVMGLSMSTIFIQFTGTSIARVFFISAGSFAALSLWGYSTKRDLTGMGSFLFMGLIGIILASLVNMFLASSALHFAISIIGVLVFAGLTAYDTQTIKSMYMSGDSSEVADKKAISGALRLYLDFINLFMMLLQLLGNRE